MSDSRKQIQTKDSAKGKGRWRTINQIYADTEESLGTMYNRLKRLGLLEAKHHCYTLPPPGVNKGLYCNFCHQYGHETDRCVDFRHAIHQLIEDGKIPIPPSWMPPIVSFTKADLPHELDPHQALYITLKCNGRELTNVLIDDGSALNVCPKGTLYELGYNNTLLSPTDTVLGAYNNSSGRTIGTVNLQLRYKDWICDADFTVVEAVTSFSLLLGRPWLHVNKAVCCIPCFDDPKYLG